MASFEEALQRKTTKNSIQNQPKHPVKRFDIAIQRFIKVLNIDIQRLDRHRNNIIKFQELQEWSDLKKEHINANRTVQQLKANIRELERTRDQVQDDEVEIFDDKVTDVRLLAQQEAMTFLQVLKDSHEAVNGYKQHSKQEGFSDHIKSNEADLDVQEVSAQSQCSLDDQQQIEESWQNLGQSLLELNSMMEDFAKVVHQQQETIDSIEDHIDSSHSNVQSGIKNLAKASKYKAAMFPVLGAVLGGVVAGPVGLYVGAKIGGVAALLGGSVAGFAGGKYVKNKQDNSTDIELSKLNEIQKQNKESS